MCGYETVCQKHTTHSQKQYKGENVEFPLSGFAPGANMYVYRSHTKTPLPRTGEDKRNPTYTKTLPVFCLRKKRKLLLDMTGPTHSKLSKCRQQEMLCTPERRKARHLKLTPSLSLDRNSLPQRRFTISSFLLAGEKKIRFSTSANFVRRESLSYEVFHLTFGFFTRSSSFRVPQPRTAVS